jgi:hypothetical protein
VISLRKIIGASAVLSLAGVALYSQQSRQDPGTSSRASITRYCTGCHNAQARAGSLVLDPNAPFEEAETWEKVARRLRMRTMPPAGAPRPDEATYRQTTAWIEGQLDQRAASNPDPGQPLLHRLNRTEYANAIEDLLGVKIDVASLLPPDDSAFGFDNNASVLGVSSVLLERYLSAGDRVSALVTGDPSFGPGSDTYRARQDLSQDQHIEGMPFGTVGGIQAEHTFPLTGEYELRLSFFRNNLEIMRGIERIRWSSPSMASASSCAPSAAPRTLRRCATQPTAPTRSTLASACAFPSPLGRIRSRRPSCRSAASGRCGCRGSSAVQWIPSKLPAARTSKRSRSWAPTILRRQARSPAA